jgi:arginyl-tRNA synthetase
MLEIMNQLGRRAAEALKKRFPDREVGDELAVVRATKVEFGDLQISSALQLAKPLGAKPREIADVIAAELRGHPALRAVEIAGPGFVNLFLDEEWLAAHAGDALALRQMGAGQTVVLDYSSPNVAKSMHIGHIRSTIIGDAIKRVLRAVGYRVIADNHLGDWGTQFGKLIVAYRKWLDAAAFEKSPVEELLRLYIKFQEEEKVQRSNAAPQGPADGAAGGLEPSEGSNEEDEKVVTPLIAEARAELVKLQQGDPENVALWKRFVEVSLRDFDRVYQRLGVTFDEYLGESAYNDRLAATVERLLAEKIAEESQGAIVVFNEGLPPFLVRKADGGFLYGTTDVAGLLYRVERWNPSRIIIVTDERQQLHFKQLFATGRRLGITCSLEHVWFGLMRLPEGTISTREGKLIGLEALLDEAERRALAVAAETNPELSETERREVARVVGIGAVKYNDLSKDRQTLVTFTWDKALALQGNSGPYLQYAYARIRSILRKAAADGAGEPGARAAVSIAPERALAVKLLGLDEAVEQVARTARPHVLCDYLYDLAGAFSTFYNEAPVLKAEPAVRAARLKLCALTADTLARGLELLGIEVLERM